MIQCALLIALIVFIIRSICSDKRYLDPPCHPDDCENCPFPPCSEDEKRRHTERRQHKALACRLNPASEGFFLLSERPLDVNVIISQGYSGYEALHNSPFLRLVSEVPYLDGVRNQSLYQIEWLLLRLCHRRE